MKEICIFNNSSKASAYGIGTYLREYTVCLVNLGFRVNLIHLENTIGDVSIREVDGIRTIVIPFLDFQKIHSYNRIVCHLLRFHIEDSPDLFFHFNYTYHSSLLDGVKKYYPLSKSVFTVHYLNWSYELNGNISLFRKIIEQRTDKDISGKYRNVLEKYNEEKDMFEKSDAIVCLSEDTRDLLAKEYSISSQKLHLVRNGLDDKSVDISPAEKEILRKEFHVRENEKILLFVGRVDKIKGVFPLISCFDRVIEEFPDCRLVIVGDGDMSMAIRHCKEVWTKITFTGILDREEVYKWYRIADIALFPSFYEECSYTGIEMMKYGLPVIASDGYSVGNMFCDSAEITPIGDMNNEDEFKNNLGENILKVLKCPHLQAELSELSKKRYTSAYTLNKMEEGYRELFSIH
ncbi:MAG: TIGR04157 family glycosyltransferase [Tannerellaceae bacterium]|jgi:glycosyltransferase|nr:TIGR04157 family glycosyltransferase [Tannerellaceae bacterium]